jgi:NHS family xanthosine MFS transporter
MAFIFYLLYVLGGALQLTNAYGDVLDEFKHFPKYADSFVVEYSTIIMSILKFQRPYLFLLFPFLRRFGIKQVMLISMLAWVLRWLFAYGNPTDGLWMIIMSCVVYGMAFDFFISQDLCLLKPIQNQKNRSSAQGLFMMMTMVWSSF